MRFFRQSLVGLFLASVTLALFFYAAHIVMDAIQVRMAEESRTPEPRERVFAVNVVDAEYETVTPILEAFGQIQSRRTLEIRAAASGRVVWLDENFVEGGSVEAGAELVRVDPADAQTAWDRVDSDVLDARAELRDAERALGLAQDELAAAEDQAELRERAFQRQRDLTARGVGTAAAQEEAELTAVSARQSVLSRRIAVSQAEGRLDQAKTNLSRAEIALAEADRGLADTTVTASFSGTLSDVAVVEGRLVTINEKLAQLVDPTLLEVAFRVSTVQYARLLDDSGRLMSAPVRVKLSQSGGLVASGRVSRDAAVTGEGQSGRLIFARLDAAPGFKPDDFVTVEVEEPPLDGVARVPASALDAQRTVLVLGADDRLESLDVVLVRRQGDDVLIRGEGLAGREVIVGRTPLLGAGIRVRPLRDSADATPEAPAMVELTDERRAKLVAFVEGNRRMPAEAKERVLGQLGQAQVPAQLVERIESRMGG